MFILAMLKVIVDAHHKCEASIRRRFFIGATVSIRFSSLP